MYNAELYIQLSDPVIMCRDYHNSHGVKISILLQYSAGRLHVENTSNNNDPCIICNHYEISVCGYEVDVCIHNALTAASIYGNDFTASWTNNSCGANHPLGLQTFLKGLRMFFSSFYPQIW